MTESYDLVFDEEDFLALDNLKRRTPIELGDLVHDSRSGALWTPTESQILGASGERSQPDCIVCGLSGVGKTYLLLSMYYICHWVKHASVLLNVNPKGEASESLLSRMSEIVAGANTLHTSDYAKKLEFDLQKTSKWHKKLGLSTRQTSVMFLEGSQGSLRGNDQNSWSSTFLSQVDTPNTLVVCVDITNPQAEQLIAELPKLFERLNLEPVVESDDLVPKKRKLWKSKPRIKRFLLVLTKVDLLALEASRRMRLGQKVELSDKAYVPAVIADRIDPLAQAAAVLGMPVLLTIDHLCGSKTKWAISVCSSGGFHAETGEPFLTELGIPNEGAYVPTVDVLQHWRPFGVREIMDYIIDGSVSGPVRQIGPQDLSSQREY